MKALVVYDTVFGNTEQIARVIGEALGTPDDVTVVKVDSVKPEQLSKVPLLLVGSPTRGFKPTPAIVDFLKDIPSDALNGIKVAAFDTRVAASDIKSPLFRFIVNLGGYAAKAIAGQLKKKGGELIAPPEGFCVMDREGPMKAGEVDRAASWAKSIG